MSETYAGRQVMVRTWVAKDPGQGGGLMGRTHGKTGAVKSGLTWCQLVSVNVVPAAPRLDVFQLGAKAGLGLENIRNLNDKMEIWVLDSQSA